MVLSDGAPSGAQNNFGSDGPNRRQRNERSGCDFLVHNTNLAVRPTSARIRTKGSPRA